MTARFTFADAADILAPPPVVVPIRPWAKDSPPWSFCGDRADPDFGTLWAEPGAAGSTILYFDRATQHHAMTVYDRCVGGIAELQGRRWTVRRLPDRGPDAA